MIVLGILNTLKELENSGTLYTLIANQPDKAWQSLDINYHPPRVERLWTVFGNYHINLHRIHPCEPKDALFHPHPWPSAMHLINGAYEMAIGYGKGNKTPPVATLLEVSAGSYYEMSDSSAWHYVRPLEKPALTIMLTGRPWARKSPKSIDPLAPLSKRRKEILLEEFREFYKNFRPSL